MEDQLIAFEEFEDFFNALMEVHGRRANSTLCELYWKCLEPARPMVNETVEVMCRIINDPTDKMPSPAEIKGLIRQQRIDRAPKLPANPELNQWQPLDISQARQFRLTILASVYKSQGDSSFYRAMLASKGGIYSEVAANVIAASGLTMADVAVTHEDVLMFMGVAPDDSADDIAVQPQSDRTIDLEKRDRLLAEVMADG